jgi:hypothetical protein
MVRISEKNQGSIFGNGNRHRFFGKAPCEKYTEDEKTHLIFH